jgi:hypothetical protein
MALRKVLWACVLLGVVSFLAYAPVWKGYFLADDFAYASMYANRPLTYWAQIAATDWTRGVWGYQFDEMRAMLALAFWWDGRVWPLQPAGYHFTNLLFHAAATLLVFLLARIVFHGERARPLFAGLLFSLHPVHAEAVAWISGRADPMCACFSLASLWAFALYQKRAHAALYATSLAMFILALFSKEIAITFPLLILGWRRKFTRDVAGYFAVLAGYLVLRRTAFAHTLREDQFQFSVLRDFAIRQFEYLHFLVPMLPVALVVVLCVVALFALRRWPLVWFFGPWWFLVCVAPLIMTYSSPRHLYLASAGICLLIPALLPRRYFHLTAALVLIVAGFLLVRQTLQWRFSGDESVRAHGEIERFARVLPPGSGLIIDIPEILDGHYLWLSSLPFALEPPYGTGEAYRRLRVVERPLAYRYWSGSPDGKGRTWMDDRLPVMRDLVAHPAECYRITLAGREQVPLATVTALAEWAARHKPYDSIFDVNAEWISFWRSRSGLGP